jgi:PAS domain S-box-containing protein
VHLNRELRVVHLVIGLSFVVLYSVLAWALRGNPLAHSLVAHAALILSAALVPAVVIVRRREWLGCQRLFWDVIAVSLTFWIVGHFGWAYDLLIVNEPSWLKWHTLFSLCAGIGPLIALLARPHRGPRPRVVAPVAMILTAYCLLGLFIYSYFVLLPSIAIDATAEAQARLLYFIQANRFALFVAMALTFWFARGTSWRLTYLKFAIGIGLGVIFRLSANEAIFSGTYRVGGFYDFAWIVPYLFYGWAALGAPASPRPDADLDEPHEVSPVGLLAVPALLIPLVGYGTLNFESIGEPVDTFRLFLTSVATVAALGLVTLRLAAQASELRRVDARLTLLAAATENTGDLILITRVDGRLVHANAAFLRAFGYGRADLSTLNFVDLVEPGMDHMRHDIPAEVKAKGVWRGTLRGLRRDGTTFPAACTITGLRDPAGRLTHFVGVERDITDDLQLRDQLVHSERLSAIGELIAGVAHEINNPLQTIIGCTELMLDEPEGANAADLELVRKEAMRAGQIVRNLLAFARRGAPDRVAIDLNELVRATAELRAYHLEQINIALVMRCAPRMLPVLVNREEIRQVILNLLLNAEHAIASKGAGGSITIETSAGGGEHSVDVTDSGPGISAELRGRIFEPFFTTREVGEGTGLGLSISHGIASSHGGSLKLVDSPSGARFRLTLPAPAGSAALMESTIGSGRALVVAHEEPMRKLITRLLERRGFEVSEADTGETAMALALDGRPGLIICDLGAPSISGFDLYRQLAEKDPESAPRFLFIRGERGASEAEDSAETRWPVLVKPFTASELENALAEAGVAASRQS